MTDIIILINKKYCKTSITIIFIEVAYKILNICTYMYMDQIKYLF